MAQEKPKSPAKREGLEHQDQSIKARKFQLYEEREHEDLGVVKPFAEYLRNTPPAPLPQGVRATLWAIGALVVLLFIAALIIGGPRKVKRPQAERLAPHASPILVGWVSGEQLTLPK